jgi:hypothetical protein
VVLRAKKICKVSCGGYFSWAQSQPKAVEAVLTEYEGIIKKHLKDKEISFETLRDGVFPKSNICTYCGKDFESEGWLERHLKKKHRRELDAKD